MIDDKLDGKIPDHPCLVWAKEKKQTWYKYIVRIKGDAPFLSAEVVCDFGSGTNNGRHMPDWEIKRLVYGPEIEWPKPPKHLIDKSI